MEDIKRRFENEIAARLAGAAESDAKSEMIEELADNLAGRYGDLTAAGMAEEDAFARAMDELGDVDELTAYLNSLEPEDAGPAQGQDELDELFKVVGDVGRAAAEAGRKAVHKAGDILHSEATQNAIEEGKKGVYKVRDFLKNVAEQGAIAWNGRNVKLDFSQDEQGQSIPSDGLLRLDVELPNGDVDVRPALEPDGPVGIEGPVDRLDISTTEDGVLTIRQRYTASGQFLSFRGISGTDVSLTVPARRWDSIHVATACGDVDIGGGIQVDRLNVRTASGDIDCRVSGCAQGELKTASGDIDCRGSWQSVLAETASGDVDLDGTIDQASVNTVSGDVALDGAVTRARVRSMSGDIQVKSGILPRELDLGSKSGDVEAKVPDEGPFQLRLETVSGQARYELPRRWPGGAEADGDAPRFSLTSISGDVKLGEY